MKFPALLFLLSAFLDCRFAFGVDQFPILSSHHHKQDQGSAKVPPVQYYEDPPVGSTDTIGIFQHKVRITYPTEAGEYPVVVFLGGMLGLVPVEWYADLHKRVAYAGRGSIVVAMDLKLVLPGDYFAAADHLDSVISWILQGGLGGYIPSNIRGSSDRLFLATHSSGAQSATVVWKKRKSSIAGLIFVDPVDAMGDPSQKISFMPFAADSIRTVNSFPPPVTDPSNPNLFKNLQQPILMIASGLCHISAVHLPPPPFLNMTKIKLPPIFADDNLWPACCPKNLGPERFWNTLSLDNQRQIYLWNFTEYGHCDVLDDRWVWTNRLMRFCRSIVDDRMKHGERNVFDLSLVRKTIAALTAAFLDVFWFKSDIGTEFLSKNMWNHENVTIKNV